MSEMQHLTITIDDKECIATKGESILTIARNNGITIPTLCDLKKLSPTGACRMCVVEEENGNVIASCKSYVTRPIKVFTNTERLQKYRNQIMSFLCINHPLECGVCDKSGECELQDKVLESKVDIQPFFALQKKNDFVHFHNKIYDESLCIVCERCARTCNEFVGNNVLSVLAGGFSSKIGVNFDAYCEDCDECVSVCPTGAMISQRFIYTSNAWELEKIPSHCLHCSLRCELSYEIKHNIDSKKEVYRIKNQAHIHQLCHAGRHNFMRHNPLNTYFTNTNALPHYDLMQVMNTIEAIRLNVNVTNEEALIAQKLAINAQKKIYCDEALYYKEFGDIVKSISKRGFIALKDMLTHADVCINLGTYMFDELPVLRSDLSKLSLKNGVKNVWIHTIAEPRFKSDLEIKYEVHNELALSIFLLHIFMPLLESAQQHDGNYTDPFRITDKQDTHATFADSLLQCREWLQTLDLGNLIAESNMSEYELQRLQEICRADYPIITPDHQEIYKRNNIVFLVGQDFYMSPHYQIIAKILGLLDSLNNVIVMPLAYGNANGIKEICDLSFDNGAYNKVLGIRARGEYEISSYHYKTLHDNTMQNCTKLNTHYPILPLQFIEGSFIDINSNLVKILPSFVEDGFSGIESQTSIITSPISIGYNNPNLDLLDICRDYLKLDSQYLIDITNQLPFNALPFDDLETKRLEIPFDTTVQASIALPEVTICEGSGIFIYKAALSGNHSFYSIENDSINMECGIIKVSEQFCIATKINNNDEIVLDISGQHVKVRVEVMPTLHGMVAVLLSDKVLDSKKYFDYKRVYNDYKD